MPETINNNNIDEVIGYGYALESVIEGDDDAIYDSIDDNDVSMNENKSDGPIGETMVVDFTLVDVDDDDDENKYENKKIFFEVGDKVSAPWYEHEGDALLWYDGVVIDYSAVRVGDYGPVRRYKVKFDDDGTIREWDDEFVFLREDVCLCEAKVKWQEVKNITDQTSRDKWAKIVGWYVAIIGKRFIFWLIYLLEQAIL